ncbi:MAG: SDR family oxidoreductase [Rhodospirillales bacterium]|jgi:3-oxoacyl-[acyl-carrier protein] reductase|nr:SDR family oxidoreductase [Rhodospirillales bacterium]MBT3906084.1 SDR family oxidoreductase [Rhodospirillaceae bacterium]MBT5033251.1 SDR family oxidoreductase [Rhodospirillaceae bacterium]MBT6218977.1 SDR family oxidoreductase [Rhodospirillaceae bacterium]MBT6362121.1 SDR family oxidoreductase [Rhodospirillaceae bacterium]
MTYNPDDRQAAELKFSDLHEGYQSELSHTISQDDLNTFAALTGDFNPIHIDAEYARTTSFGKPIVHGMLTSSFISTMIGMLLPGRGALWMEQTLKFTRPAFVGDSIRVVATVKQLSTATNTMVLDVKISNQDDTTIVTGQSTVTLTAGKTADEAAATDAKPIEAPQSSKNKEATGGVIFISGGSGGIGAACAKNLAAQGYAIAVNYNSNQKGADAVVAEISAAGGQAISVQGDVASEADVERIFSDIESQLGTVSGIVHCAAPEPIPTAFEDTNWAIFEATLSTQIGGARHCTHRALANMMENSTGSIVLIGSIYGDNVPPAMQSAYVTAKAALAGFSRALAVELGPKGIRVNVVAPGMTQTPMLANLPNKAKMLAQMNTPLRRLADPEDIANAVAFLISDNARHITGETLHVSGGVSMS